MNTSFLNNDGNYLPLRPAAPAAARAGSRGRATRAFTLTEILIAIALVVIIVTVAVVNLTGVVTTGQENAAKLFVTDGVDAPLMNYRLDTGSFPTTAQGLLALVEAPEGVVNWKGPYLKAGAKLQDPFGTDYNYAYPGTHNPKGYDCWSAGVDKTSGTADDIGNW